MEGAAKLQVAYANVMQSAMSALSWACYELDALKVEKLLGRNSRRTADFFLCPHGNTAPYACLLGLVDCSNDCREVCIPQKLGMSGVRILQTLHDSRMRAVLSKGVLPEFTFAHAVTLAGYARRAGKPAVEAMMRLRCALRCVK